MSELMIVIRTLACYSDHYDNNYITEEIGKRMYSVGNKSGTAAENTSCDFCKTENGIYPESDPCDMTCLPNRFCGFGTELTAAVIVLFYFVHTIHRVNKTDLMFR